MALSSLVLSLSSSPSPLPWWSRLRAACVALAGVCALVVLVDGCATARAEHRGAPVSGAFDDDDGGRSYARGAPATDEAEVSRGSVSGLFDFGGRAKKEAMPPPPAAAANAPAADYDADGIVDQVDRAPEEPEPTTGEAGKYPEASGPRLVIYTGSLTVVVVAVEAAVEKLSARVKELNGYVEHQTGNSGANNASVTLRVPAEKFYDLVNELGTYGQVTAKQINAEDVTKKVFDIELRLDTAEKSRQRLLDLLKTATKMEEILQIENEVRRLTDEIEGMKGELRFLKDQVSMSTLTVTFYSNAPPPVTGPTRVRSRFEWINQVGIESVLNNF